MTSSLCITNPDMDFLPQDRPGGSTAVELNTSLTNWDVIKSSSKALALCFLSSLYLQHLGSYWEDSWRLLVFLLVVRVWVWYFSQAASGILSSKSSWPAIYSYEDRRSFHSGTQLQMEAIEKSLNLAAVQLHHQTPHAAQLFSLATASSKELFFPDYASVGCLWRPGQCLLKKERKSEQLLLLFSRELYRENSV